MYKCELGGSKNSNLVYGKDRVGVAPVTQCYLSCFSHLMDPYGGILFICRQNYCAVEGHHIVNKTKRICLEKRLQISRLHFSYY